MPVLEELAAVCAMRRRWCTRSIGSSFRKAGKPKPPARTGRRSMASWSNPSKGFRNNAHRVPVVTLSNCSANQVVCRGWRAARRWMGLAATEALSKTKATWVPTPLSSSVSGNCSSTSQQRLYARNFSSRKAWI